MNYDYLKRYLEEGERFPSPEGELWFKKNPDLETTRYVCKPKFSAYDFIKKHIEAKEEKMKLKNFRTTNVNVECGANLIPIIEFTVEGSLKDVGPSNIQRLSDLLEDTLNNRTFGLPSIKNVIFNDPATIVFWTDGTKTVVKAQDEAYDPEKGMAMAIAKKALGNQGNYCNVFKKWLPEEEFDEDVIKEACEKIRKAFRKGKA